MKKTVSAILIMMMLLSMSVTMVSGLSLCSYWAKENIEKADEVGIYTDGGDLTQPISREKFCEVVYNYIKVSGVDFAADSSEPFTDTDNEKVAALYSLGIINGKSEKSFAPNDTLTREEAATILSRTIDKIWAEKYVPNKEVTFFDYWDISDWSEESIVEMYNLGIIIGMEVKENGNVVIAPKRKLTAEQAITMVVRMYEKKEPETQVSSFADKLYTTMPKDKNYMFSPFSIKTALMMAANGAEGETRKEILETLGISDVEEYNKNTKALISSFNALDIMKLNVANSVWINSDVTSQRFTKAYSDKVADVFEATSDIVNKNNALPKINGWVNEKTNGKIPAIINEGNRDFAAMLINAVYFKARWEKEFHKGATKPDTFTQRNGETVTVDFMNRTGYMGYANCNGVEVLKLPYLRHQNTFDEKGGYIGSKSLENVNINMYFMMSDETFAPEEILSKDTLPTSYVSLSVPKFNIEYGESLNKKLQRIGINKAFEEAEAEFQSMVTSENLWINDVIHKTYIKVDEEGTEAAAVTAIGMAGSALPPEPIVVKFNKPFTFVIRDDVSGEILFMGEYAFAK